MEMGGLHWGGEVKHIKALANRWADDGEDFSAIDIKLHLGLDCCTATIMNALTSEGPVRWGIAWGNEGERHLQVVALHFRGCTGKIHENVVTLEVLQN